MNRWSSIKQNISKVKDISTIGLSNIVGTGISATFWLFIASSIGPEQYGEIHYFLGIAGIGQIFSLIATSNTMTVYSAKNDKIQSTLFVISLVIGLVSSIIIFLVYQKLDASLLVFGYIIFEAINAVMLGRKQFTKYAKFILLQKFLTLFIGFGFYFLFNAEWIIFALVLTYIPYVPLLVKEIKKYKIELSLLIPKKKYIINNYAIDISESFAGQIDKVLIAPLLGFVLLGNYVLSIQFFMILMLLPYVFYKYILPLDSSQKETAKIRKAGTLLSVGICMIGIFVLSDILPITFPEFSEIKNAMGIMSFAVIPATVALLFKSKLLAIEKNKHLLVSKILGTSTLVIGFIIFGPIYGIIGLSVVFVFSYIIEASIVVIVFKKEKLS